MNARLRNPVEILPEMVKPILQVAKAAKNGSVPEATLELVHMRCSQINGCSVCIDGGWREALKAGETEERLFMVSAWREAPYFTDAERAALALAEAATRLSDRPDPVPDEIWDEAARHYDEKGLASIVTTIAVTNFFNRVNAATRQIAAGGW